MRRILIVLATAATVLLPLGVAPAHASAGGYEVAYYFWTNSSDLDFAYTKADGGTFAQTNRRFTSTNKNGAYYLSRRIVVTDAYFTASSRLSTDETEDASWVECAIYANGVEQNRQSSTGAAASVYC